MVTKLQPPGFHRPLPKPTHSGKLPFTHSPLSIRSETAYWIWGDLSSTQTPLICLHGGPGVPHSYILPFALLWQDYHIPVILYDQIGCGESTHFPRKKGDHEFWTPELFMAELDNLKEQLLGRDTEFDLLGQSWGGMLAAQYTLERQPKGLRKLVLEGGPASVPLLQDTVKVLRSRLPKNVRDCLERCEKARQFTSPEYEAAVQYFMEQHGCRLEPWPKEVMDAFDASEEDNTVYYSMYGLNEMYVFGSLKDWSMVGELHRITEKTVPGGVLIMNGYYDEVQDEVVEPFFEEMTAKTKWIRFALSSHMPFWEEGEKFLRDLGKFLVTE